MISGRTIEIEEGGARLDAAVLNAFPTSTRAFVREAIARGDVTLSPDGAAPRIAAKGYRTRSGDRIAVRRLLEACDNLVALEPGVKSLADAGIPPPVFEDASIVAFDKPAGMPVQPLSCAETGTLMNAVVALYPECRGISEPGPDGRPANTLMAGAVHRIDADTSGLVVVARSQTAFDALRTQFATQTVRKTYLALVEGAVAVGGTLENDLVHDPTAPCCRMIDAKRARCAIRSRPLHAVTRFTPVGRTTVGCEERTLLEVVIYTGVTHQIRAQLAMAGMHIVNDRLYGAFAVEGQKGHCLHALSAGFAHPDSGDAVELRTPAPPWAF